MSGRVIRAKEVLEAIRDGLGDLALMEKYKLSPKGLEDLYEQLMRAGLLKNRTKTGNVRRCPRHDVNFVLPVYFEDHPERLGEILDISESGIRVRGLRARPDDKKILIIPLDELFDMEHLRLRTICRWVFRDVAEGEHIAGFEMVHMPGEDLLELKKLIELTDEFDISETEETDESPEVTERRRLPRHACPFLLPIHDAVRRENKGKILNVTEEGFAVDGISCEQGNRMTVVIPSYHCGRRRFDSVVLITECRWVKQDESGKSVCGFKIIERTAKNYKEMQRLVRTLADAQLDQ